MGVFSAFRQSGVVALVCAMSWAIGSTRPAAAEPQAEPLLATAAPPVSGSSEANSGNLALTFRLEGAPRVESVFGDVAAYKTRIDAFTAVGGEMESERRRFARAAHTLQTALGPAPRVGPQRPWAGRRHRNEDPCQAEEVSEALEVATRAHSRFHELGVVYEQTFKRIRELDELGESAGLTPDYRSRVMGSQASYELALRDMAEMTLVMRKQLAPNLVGQGCVAGERVADERAAPSTSSARRKRQPKANPTFERPPSVRARVATFFVDNRRCQRDLDVYVDGTLLGRVAASSHAAFQTLNGRHSLCLLSNDTILSCGDTGTMRTAFVHDGFRVQRSCAR